MLAANYAMLARFNAWANKAIYKAAEDLGETKRRAPQPAAYFGSILGTLNHQLIVDYMWFPRLEGVSRTDLKLNQTLHENFDELRAAREAEDARIIKQVDAIDEAKLATDCTFKDSKGNPWTMATWQILSTVFNHQTHHRGQVHALIKASGAEPPALDIPVYLRSLK